MIELLRGLPPLLASHLVLVLVALVAALVVSAPLALVVRARPRAAAVVLGVAGVVQTLPGLALLALMVPLLATTGGLGLGVSAFGFAPAVLALAVYAVLPILRSLVVGLRGVDPAIVDAARGLGMSPAQLLHQVELPLAAPVIAAGLRTATVWTVGAATLATPVGQACLGNYIFAGLQTRSWPMLLTGVAAAAVLAIGLDAVLGAIERALAARPRGRLVAPAAALVGLLVLVLGVLPWWSAGAAGTGPVFVGAATGPARPGRVTRVRIGAKTFTEQYILAELLRTRLVAAGLEVEVTASLGSAVIFDALATAELDVYVDYTGTLWTNHVHGAPGVPRWRILAELEGWLAREHGVRSLGSLGFENAYALAVRRDLATQRGLATIADLVPHAPALAIGGDYEFFGRREWAAVRGGYQLAFARTVTFDPTLLYEAVARGEVDVIAAFSSDGRIAATDLVVLADPAGALPPYDALLLLGPRVAGDPRVVCALADLRGAISVERIRAANLLVDRDARSVPAAAAWLASTLPPVPTRCASAP